MEILMSDLSVQQQKQLDNYLKKNPNISREKAIIQLFGGGGCLVLLKKVFL